MFSIKQEVLERLYKHAQEDSPVEACGYVAGSEGIADRSYKMVNVDNAEDHFTLDPKEQFAKIKQMREEGVKAMAVYHSHPASPARPSEEDIKLAYDPEISYIIVSLEKGEPYAKSFKIRQGNVEPEEIQVL
ncbi:MAG: M67 family metallopeptidase [Planctomycetes bacterium]|nr:M67 family metallopeptidase [Planctomycetota bacterium]